MLGCWLIAVSKAPDKRRNMQTVLKDLYKLMHCNEGGNLTLASIQEENLANSHWCLLRVAHIFLSFIEQLQHTIVASHWP